MAGIRRFVAFGTATMDEEASSVSTVEHETSEHAPGKVRCYSGYGPFGNVAVVLGATVGAGALSNAIGGLISPFVGLVAGIVGAVLCAMLVISDINRIIVE